MKPQRECTGFKAASANLKIGYRNRKVKHALSEQQEEWLMRVYPQWAVKLLS